MNSSAGLEQLQQEYGRLLMQVNFDESTLDYSILEGHAQFLDRLDVLEHSSYSVFDMHKKEHVYLSSSFERIMQYDREEALEEGNSFFDNRVHPDDFLDSLSNGIRMIKFAYEQPIEKRRDYKLINQYRIRNGKGDFVRVIEQFQVLELCPNGNLWLSLCVLDHSPNQDLQAPFESCLLNLSTGRIMDFDDPVPHKASSLSPRETEVLNLISQGKISKQIAEELYISVHTVNTHRQRIISKLNAQNTAAALRYAGELGIIG